MQAPLSQLWRSGPVINSPANLFSRRTRRYRFHIWNLMYSSHQYFFTSHIRVHAYACTCRGRRSLRSDLVNASGYISPFRHPQISFGAKSHSIKRNIKRMRCDTTFQRSMKLYAARLKVLVRTV